MFLWWHLRRSRDNKGFASWSHGRDAGRDAATGAIRKIGTYRSGARDWREAVNLGEPGMKPLAEVLAHSGERHGQIVDALRGTTCPAAVRPLRVILERGALSTFEFAWREKAADALGGIPTKEALDALIANVHLP